MRVPLIASQSAPLLNKQIYSTLLSFATNRRLVPLALALMQIAIIEASTMGDTEQTNKTERLRIVPMEKLSSVIPAKMWEAHRKNLQALADAKAAAATTKAAVCAALAKSLKLQGAEPLTFWSDAEKLVVGRRPKEKVRKQTTLRDLTAP